MDIDQGAEQARKIDQLFYALMEDVRTACELWHERTDDFSRRVYVKTSMSTVEGMTQVMKRAALLFDHRNSPPTLTAEEVILLKEESVSLKGNGKPAIKRAKLPFLPNFIFAINSLAKVFNIEIIVKEMSHYENFKEAILLRNRITHPINTEDLTISLSEMKSFELAMKFFREATEPVLHRK